MPVPRAAPPVDRAARPAGRRTAAVRVVAAAAVACLAALGARGGARADRIYLPALDASSARALPCRPVDDAPCGGDGRWTLTCGGFGALRDLVAVPAASGEVEVLAVGDGVARLRVGGAAGSALGDGDWSIAGQIQPASADIDRTLGGLGGLTAGGCRPGDPTCAWAVGARPWVGRYDGACWRPDVPILLEDGRRVSEGAARLTSVVLYPGGGLAVGERGGVAASAQLVADPDGQAAWRLAPPADGGGGAALTDVDVLGDWTRGEAWAVDRSGAVMRRPIDAARWITDAVLPGGTARELAMIDAEDGWAFGRSADGAETVVWHGDGTAWRADRRFAGQGLVDAYKDGPLTLWLGLTPGAPGEPVLYLRGADAAWRPAAGPPPGPTGPSGGGHRAIGPLPDGRVVYAAGGTIWLHDPSAGWAPLWRRLDLVDVAPVGSGAWVLAATDGGTRILAVEPATGRLVDPAPDAPDGPALRALAARDGAAWAVGDHGETWRTQAPGAPWRRLAPGLSGASDILRDVAVDAEGTAWAAGRGADGRGRVWRWADDGAGWEPVAAVTDALAAIAPAPGPGPGQVPDAGDGVGAVAVGGRWIVTVRPAAACAAEGARPTGEWCVGVLRPCYVVGGCLEGLSAVASAEAGLWVANDTFVARHRAGGPLARWRATDWRAAIPRIDGTLKPLEAPIAALALHGPGDGWVAFDCCARRDGAGRETGYAVHFDGAAWTDAHAVNMPLRAAAASAGGAAWFVGDGATLVRRAPR